MTDPVTSYSTLVSALVDICEDDSTELRAYIPVAIANAETKLARELSHEINEYTSTISIAGSVATVTKPAGHKLTHSVTFVTSAGRTVPLKRKEISYLDEYWPQSTSVGTPVYYGNVDRTTLRICPADTSGGSVKIFGERRPDALTSASPNNVYTSVCPDALFYATLMECAVWQRNAQLQAWAQELYISTRDALTAEGIRSRRDDGTSFRFEPPNSVVQAMKNPD